MKKITLHKIGRAAYLAAVRPKGTGLRPFFVRITGPDPYSPRVSYPLRWMVETSNDEELFFRDLKRVRQYLNRHFETANLDTYDKILKHG